MIDTIKQFLNKYNKLFVFGLAFLGTYGVGYLFKQTGMEKSHFSIMLVFVLAAIYIMLMKVCEPYNKKRVFFSYGISYCFSVCMIIGYQLQVKGMTDGGFLGKGLIFLKSATLAIAFYPFIYLLFQGIEKIVTAFSEFKPKKQHRTIILFFISAITIFICLIPVWLAYYPIIMSYDFHRQVNEAEMGFQWFWPYQPIAHTWIIWLALQIGNLLGSRESGMACMAIMHMIVYSLVTGYACAFIYRVIKKIWLVVIAIFFFGIFPFNTVFVLCSSKDVLFSSIFLLFFILLCEWQYFSQGKKKYTILFCLIITGCLMVQFRNNALYAMVAFLFILVIISPFKKKLEIFLVSVCLIVGSISTSSIIKKAIGTEMDIAKVEMYSVPIQQFTRVGYLHEESMDEDDIVLLDYYIPQRVWQDYNPAISDGAKASVVNDWYSDITEGNFIKDWFYFFKKFPNEFVDAFWELTRGYWFPDDTSWAECLGYGEEQRFGAIYTYNSSETELGSIEHISKLPSLEKLLEKIVSGNIFYQWPVISILFRCSTYVWGLLFLWIMGIYLKKRTIVELLLLPLAYLGTMLLGPVALSRYVYPFFLMMPIWIILLFIPEQKVEL